MLAACAAQQVRARAHRFAPAWTRGGQLAGAAAAALASAAASGGGAIGAGGAGAGAPPLDGEWSDVDTLQRPNLVLAIWITSALLAAGTGPSATAGRAFVRGEVAPQLLEAWAAGLGSPSLTLKLMASTVVSAVLQGLAHGQWGRGTRGAARRPRTRRCRRHGAAAAPAALRRCVDALPVARLEALALSACGARRRPALSRYAQGSPSSARARASRARAPARADESGGLALSRPARRRRLCDGAARAAACGARRPRRLLPRARQALAVSDAGWGQGSDTVTQHAVGGGAPRAPCSDAHGWRRRPPTSCPAATCAGPDWRAPRALRPPPSRRLAARDALSSAAPSSARAAPPASASAAAASPTRRLPRARHVDRARADAGATEPWSRAAIGDDAPAPAPRCEGDDADPRRRHADEGSGRDARHARHARHARYARAPAAAAVRSLRRRLRMPRRRRTSRGPGASRADDSTPAPAARRRRRRARPSPHQGGGQWQRQVAGQARRGEGARRRRHGDATGRTTSATMARRGEGPRARCAGQMGA